MRCKRKYYYLILVGIVLIFSTLSCKVNEGFDTNVKQRNFDDCTCTFRVTEKIIHSQFINKTKQYHSFYNGQFSVNQGGYSGLLLDGKFNKISQNGIIEEDGCFRKGLKVGTWTYRDSTGLIIRQEKWFRGFKYGKTKIYYPDGSVEVLKYRKNKQLIKEEKESKKRNLNEEEIKNRRRGE